MMAKAKIQTLGIFVGGLSTMLLIISVSVDTIFIYRDFKMNTQIHKQIGNLSLVTCRQMTCHFESEEYSDCHWIPRSSSNVNNSRNIEFERNIDIPTMEYDGSGWLVCCIIAIILGLIGLLACCVALYVSQWFDMRISIKNKCLFLGLVSLNLAAMLSLLAVGLAHTSQCRYRGSSQKYEYGSSTISALMSGIMYFISSALVSIYHLPIKKEQNEDRDDDGAKKEERDSIVAQMDEMAMDGDEHDQEMLHGKEKESPPTYGDVIEAQPQI